MSMLKKLMFYLKENDYVKSGDTLLINGWTVSESNGFTQATKRGVVYIIAENNIPQACSYMIRS